MPVPASAAIASDVGHGSLGLRDNLRSLTDFLGETAGQRQAWVAMRAAKLISGTWNAYGGGTYYVTLPAYTWDGAARDIVGVKIGTEVLARVESIAACAVGCFFVGTTDLYVHLAAGGSPTGTSGIVQFGFYAGTHGVWQPTLGAERLLNAGFESWASATDANSWTEGSSAGFSINREATTVRAGTYAAKAQVDSNSGIVQYADLTQAFSDCVAGAVYRLSGFYLTSAPITDVGTTRPELIVSNWAATLILQSNGRNAVAAADYLANPTRLSSTAGEWRRFSFDFIAPTADVAIRLRLAKRTAGDTATPGGFIVWDNVSFRRVYSFDFYEPLLTIDGLPSIDASRQDAFYGPVSVGLGSLILANGHRRFDTAVADLDWTNQEVEIRVGGRFSEGGNEVLIEDAGTSALGLASDPIVTDSEFTLRLSDARDVLTQNVPSRYYTPTEFANLAEQDRGRARPLVFGTVLNIRPARIDLNADNYGVYEVADVTDSPAGMHLWGASSRFYVHAYSDDQAAEKLDTAEEIVFSYSPSEILGDVTTGRFDVLQDVRAVRLTYENNAVDFDIGGGALVAELTPGVNTLESWGESSLASSMNAAAGTADITVSYSSTTNKFTIAKGAGTLNLRCSTGANGKRAMWGVLGFSPSADRTGALTYTANDAVSRGVEQHVMRADAKGFIDDASGTYTGSASATIEKAPDVALYLMNRHLKIPFASIDLASFVAARAAHAEPLSVYLGAGGSAPQAMEILEIIEAGAGADICLEGGLWVWRTRDTSTPAGVVDLFDYDLLTWEASYNAEDYYSVVQVAYHLDPDGQKENIVQQTTSSVALRFGRPQQRTFRTYLRDEADATTRLGELATEASTKRRRFRFTAKGKLLLTPVGAKVRVNRARGLGASGALSQVLVRILSKADSLSGWSSSVEAVEVV